MKQTNLSGLRRYLCLLLLVLAACRSEAAATPTPAGVNVPEPTGTPIVAPTALPAQTATAVPPTASPVPTAAPTETATAVPEPTTAPASFSLTIDNPAPGQTLFVAREATLSGTIDPAPGAPLQITLYAAGAAAHEETLLASAEADPDTGQWQVTAPLHPRRTGPATLRVMAGESEATVDLVLQYAPDESGTFVTVNHPHSGDTAVAGQTLLIDGESRNLIDGKVQIGAFGCPVDSEENRLAQIEITAGNGPWQAQLILPETAAADCDQIRLRATTGGLTSDAAAVQWASDQLLALAAPDAEAAHLLTLGDPDNLRFRPGHTTSVFGTAVNAVDGAVLVQLMAADGAETVVAAGTAVPDRFGYWELELTLPDEAPIGEATLLISTGSEETYRSHSLAAQIIP